MSVLNNSLLLGADLGGYQIARSLRFNSSDSAYLSRTPASAGNRKTWTFSFWAKRSNIVTRQLLLEVRTASNDTDYFSIEFTIDTTAPRIAYGGWNTTWGLTTQVFRDVSAWYHIVLAVDTTQSTASNRTKLYVNGSQVTNFDIQAYPAQNSDTGVNAASLTTIGSGTAGSNFYSGYLADIHLIDGQALTPSSFAETNATTGQWVPKAYSGSYGTNGFQLKFADNSAATATTLGKDTSGNSNNWTPNNLSVTAGAGNDSLTDTPTSYGTDTGAGGSVRGNYATLNPLDQGSNITLSNGNLDITTSIGWRSIRSTFGVTSGKWYWEVTVTSGSQTLIGIAKTNASLASYIGSDASGWSYYSANGNKFNNNSQIAYGATYTSGDIIGITFDADNGTLSFYKNNTSQGTAYTGLVSGPYFPSIGIDTSVTAVFNFGQRPFAYTAPSGFKALCDTNLPAPVVAKPNTVFDVKLYTGNGSTQTISGLGFSPDLVWIKKRSGSEWHCINDTVRGAELYLSSNTTNAESGANNVLTAFTSTGYTVGSQGIVNDNGFTFASWCWDAGSSTVTNTQGSITSQVRANASAGFSIVTYTGNGTNGASVGHGLGVTPGLVIIKVRSTVNDWIVVHQNRSGSDKYLHLNKTEAEQTASGILTFSSSTFTFGTSYNATNGNGSTYVAYCFAPVAGYSSFGSYTGNGSTDGPFVYTGFRPAFVLVKGTANGLIWTIEDNKRDTYNGTSKYLQPQSSNAEGSVAAPHYDFTSNGFKIRTTDSAWNQSSNTYIYFAVAESPFAYSRAR